MTVTVAMIVAEARVDANVEVEWQRSKKRHRERDLRQNLERILDLERTRDPGPFRGIYRVDRHTAVM